MNPQAMLLRLLIGLFITSLVGVGAGLWGVKYGKKTERTKANLEIKSMQFRAAEERDKLRDKAEALRLEYAAFKDAMVAKMTEVYRERNQALAANQRTAKAVAAAHVDAGGLRDTIREFARGNRAGGKTVDDLATCRRDAETLGALLDDSVRVQDGIAEEAEQTLADYRTLYDGWPEGSAVKPSPPR